MNQTPFERRDPVAVIVESFPFESTLAELDLASLRSAFVDVMDKTNLELTKIGLDADDVELRRMLELRLRDGTKLHVEARFLSQRQRFEEDMQEQIQAQVGGTVEPGSATLCSIEVCALREPGPGNRMGGHQS